MLRICIIKATIKTYVPHSSVFVEKKITKALDEVRMMIRVFLCVKGRLIVLIMAYCFINYMLYGIQGSIYAWLVYKLFREP